MELAQVVLVSIWTGSIVFFFIMMVGMVRDDRKRERDQRKRDLKREHDQREKRLTQEIKTLERSLGSKIDTIDRSVGRLDEKVLELSSSRT